MSWRERFWLMRLREVMRSREFRTEGYSCLLFHANNYSIFELQSRQISSIVTCLLVWPLLLILSPIYFWRSPVHLFFTYIIPVIPFVVMYDGIISSLRTRTPEEIVSLMRKQNTSLNGWKLLSGEEEHTRFIGHLEWIICIRES